MLRLIDDFLDDAESMDEDSLYNTFFPETPTDDQGKLAIRFVRDELINNPGKKFNVSKMTEIMNDNLEFDRDLCVSEQTVRRILAYLEEVIPAVLREENENGAFTYFYDEALSDEPENRADAGMLVINLVDILKKYGEELLSVADIQSILYNEYGMKINRNCIARILNTICYYDEELHRLTRGRDNFYTAKIPEGYMSMDDIYDVQDAMEDGKPY